MLESVKRVQWFERLHKIKFDKKDSEIQSMGNSWIKMWGHGR